MAWFDLGLGELAKVAKDSLTNTTMVTEDRYCDKCKEITRHVSIPYEEATEAYVQQEGEKMGLGLKTLNLVNRLNNWHPLSVMFYGKPFRCGRCGWVKPLL